MVAETFGARLLRVWLRGERAGETEVRRPSGPGSESQLRWARQGPKTHDGWRLG